MTPPLPRLSPALAARYRLEDVLGMQPALHAETATDIFRQNAQPHLRQAQDARHIGPDRVRRLRRGLP